MLPYRVAAKNRYLFPVFAEARPQAGYQTSVQRIFSFSGKFDLWIKLMYFS